MTFSFNAASWLFYSGVMAAGRLAAFEGSWGSDLGAVVSIGPKLVWGLTPLVEALDVTLGQRLSLNLDTWTRTIKLMRGVPGG